MKIIRASTAGFCFGVSLALQKLDAALADFGDAKCKQRLVTLGPIIHNPLVMQEYAAQGVLCISSAEEVLPEDTVLIRAHGIPCEVEENVISRQAQVVDATCPKVKKAQIAIAKATADGCILLLFGDANHPEVQGLISYAQHNAIVFSSLDELEKLSLAADKQYVLAAQTTQDQAVFAEVIRMVQERCGSDTPVLHTICQATQQRQDEVVRLAHVVDCIIVVGGKNSGNTRRLVEVAQEQGVAAYHIEQPEELVPEELLQYSIIGITAGASTPEGQIVAVERFLDSIC